MQNINDKILQLAKKRCPENVPLEDFLFPEKIALADPFQLDGVKEASERIWQAIENEEKITIYGDYDADGITSTAILYRALTSLYPNVDHYIPERDNEGYGLNDAALAYLFAQGSQLIITVDCGIKSGDLIGNYMERGLDFIVTDHHMPGEELPETIIVNPKLSGQEIFYDLAGAGIAYFLALALAKKDERIAKIDSTLLQLAAIGTVADLVDLSMENRKIIRKGMKEINSKPILAIKSLLDANNISEVKSKNIAFFLAPVINSSGRMGNPALALELLISEDKGRIGEIRKELLSLNNKRRSLVDSTYDQAKRMILEGHFFLDPFIVLENPNWLAGIIGIVSARLADEFNRPVILLTEDQDGLYKGSGRSIENFDIFTALEAMESYLKEFGGHPQAAGLSLYEKDIPSFRNALIEYTYQTLKEDDFVSQEEIDSYFDSVAEISCDFFNDLSYLEPFGQANPEPLFSFKEDIHLDMQRIGKGKEHLRINVSDHGGRVGAVYFNYKEFSPLPCKGNLLFNLGMNEWRQKKNLQLEVKKILGLFAKDYSNLEEKIFSKMPSFYQEKSNNFTKYQKIKYNEVYNLLKDSKAIIYNENPLRLAQDMDLDKEKYLVYRAKEGFDKSFISLKKFLADKKRILLTDTFIFKEIFLSDLDYFLIPLEANTDFLSPAIMKVNPSIEIVNYKGKNMEESVEKLDRNLLARLYLSLQKNFKNKEYQDLTDYTSIFNREENSSLSQEDILRGIIIFEELGFLEYNLKNSFVDIVFANNVKKNKLENSRFFRAIK